MYGSDGRLRFHSDNPLTLLDGHQQHAKSYYFTLDDVAIGNPEVRRTCDDERIKEQSRTQIPPPRTVLFPWHYSAAICMANSISD